MQIKQIAPQTETIGFPKTSRKTRLSPASRLEREGRRRDLLPEPDRLMISAENKKLLTMMHWNLQPSSKSRWFVGLLLVLHSFAIQAESATRPNILLLSADDLAYGELGCQGNPQALTPNNDSRAMLGKKPGTCTVTAMI
jgi:hypothetical protein